MSEYWKSTPRYWCKFCKTYVRETPLERRNHEASGKHQGNIQRSLRELHKNADAATREQKRAKDEVARLNGLVTHDRGTQKSARGGAKAPLYVKPAPTAVNPPVAPKLDAATRRKDQAEQLLALGMELPPELKSAVTGIGGWETVSERVIVPIKAEGDNAIKSEDAKIKGVHKREFEQTGDSDDERNANATGSSSRTKKVWGNSLKTYNDTNGADGESEDLDALLLGIGKKSSHPAAGVDNETLEHEHVKKDETDVHNAEVLKEEEDSTSGHKIVNDIPATVVFKKRKIKR